jgi:two-component system chemotaxis sensor kinase CheA
MESGLPTAESESPAAEAAALADVSPVEEIPVIENPAASEEKLSDNASAASAVASEVAAETKPEIEEVKLPEPAVSSKQETVKTPEAAPKPAKEETQKVPVAAVASKQVDNTIRVDVERLDDLLNIVSELVLGRNMLAQVNTDLAFEHEGSQLARDLAEASKQIDLMTTELQLAVMKTRMIKIGKVFNRFPRLVRDLCRETKKDIQLIINGEETELDKTLIEEINDPLVHLVRNSADHGVESPEERVKLGKNPKGTITLSAEHEGNNIIISIEDDGKGIDPEKIKAKAIEKGLITREKANEMAKNEIYNLIFLPGFSTAEKVTNVSGRGVGMDVVKTNVAKLRGMINIESAVGVGTTMTIKLPLTLAIIQGLLVKVNAETVVIPLSSVVEVVRVSDAEIGTIHGNEVIRLRDSVLPLLRVDHVLYDDEHNSDKEWQYVVVVGIAEKIFGLKVDALVGQKEVVIKSLGDYLGDIPGISGSTIMGDGKVVMILDVAELVNNLAVK